MSIYPKLVSRPDKKYLDIIPYQLNKRIEGARSPNLEQ